MTFALPGCAIFPFFSAPPDFIGVRGTQLTEGNSPYYFAGINYWYGPYIGSPGRTGHRARLLRELDTLAANGLTNLRILGGSEGSPIPWALQPSLQPQPGVIDDSLLEGLDFLLAEMGKRRMRAVIFLTNYWEWSGGMSSYNLWADSTSFADPRTQGWDAYMDSCGSFFARSEAQTMFRDYIRRIVTRTNSVTGKRYRDDPTVMAWQLANEPRSGTDSPTSEAQFEAFVSWVDATAKYIKLLDPHHLVSTGSEGVWGSLNREENFLRLHATPSVDYLTFHCWPGIWRWFDMRRPEETWQVAESLAVDYVRTHIKLARQLQKPLVLEEFGLVRDSGETRPGSPVFYRERLLSRVFAEILDSAAAGAPIAGSNVWAWGGEASGLPPHLRWKPGYPLLGDPPHEPQGMHAIFNADSSTRRILADHSRRMRELSAQPLRAREVLVSGAP